MYAWLFPLFEIRKATTLNISTGIKYAIQPNKPNNTDDTASPTMPPMPKLLIKSKMHTASTHKIHISSRIAAFSCCCFLVGFLVVVFRFLVDFAAMIHPPWC